MLECAAKACGIDGYYKDGYIFFIDGCGEPPDDSAWSELWNPLTNPADTAEMCAKLALDTAWGVDDVIVMVPEEEAHEAQYKDHDNSRLKAWMFAATMVAARIGGYKE